MLSSHPNCRWNCVIGFNFNFRGAWQDEKYGVSVATITFLLVFYLRDKNYKVRTELIEGASRALKSVEKHPNCKVISKIALHIF